MRFSRSAVKNAKWETEKEKIITQGVTKVLSMLKDL